MKQRSSKSLQTTFLCYSNAKSTLLILLTFIKAKKNKRENFYSVHLLSFFNKHNSKTMWCMRLIYIPNEHSATGHLPFLVWSGV